MNRRAVLLYNPASGRGKAKRFADALTDKLRQDGWDTAPTAVGLGAAAPEYEGADAVVVIGGDGTVHHAAPGIATAGIPMVTAPMGTENLLAKELRMPAAIDAVRAALDAGVTSTIDLPTVNGVGFVVMCSVGLDAAVVAEVGSERAGTIRKSSYFGPVLRQIMKPTIPALRVTVDGETIIDGQRGMLVIANCRRYAVGLNPAKDASMTDGLLDVAFYPMRHAVNGIRWALLSWLQRQNKARGFVGARGRMIEVASADGDCPPVQVDGEPAPEGVALPLRFIADAGKLLVLRD